MEGSVAAGIVGGQENGVASAPLGKVSCDLTSEERTASAGAGVVPQSAALTDHRGFLSSSDIEALHGPLMRGGVFDDGKLVSACLAAGASVGACNPNALEQGFSQSALLSSSDNTRVAALQLVGSSTAPQEVLGGQQFLSSAARASPDSASGGGAILRTSDNMMVQRPETPILAYVDRAAFPGFIDPDEYEGCVQHLARQSEYQQTCKWQRPEVGAAVATITTSTSIIPGVGGVGYAAIGDDAAAWEAELAEWKRSYGCQDDDAPSSVAAASEQRDLLPRHAANPRDNINGGNTHRQSDCARDCPSLPFGPEQCVVGSANPHHNSRSSITHEDMEIYKEDGFALKDVSQRGPGCIPECPQAPAEQVVDGDADQPGTVSPASCARTEVQLSSSRSRAPIQPTTMALTVNRNSDGDGPWEPNRQNIEMLSRHDVAVDESPSLAAVTPVMPEAPRPSSRKGGRPLSSIRLAASAVAADLSDKLVPAGRYYEYTDEELALATASAMGRLGPGGSWRSSYSDSALQKRDFFIDLKKQRDKDKGREAVGPIWVHLATQAKNIASTLDLSELLQAMKCFCSVRYEDYELYMRLLGEVPHHVKHASTEQLCELIRLLARRRLRERNYVDMVAAHFLQKIRITDDTLPARLLVKTANAFAALECRSQPKFVEHFLRHMEHRIEELDAETCCLVSPLFVANYMCDALRRAYLKRCAEVQAGFQGPEYELANLACTELVLRKEQHSFLASVPTYVGRYLEKVRQHAVFDKWGSVTLPPAVAPDGPKGTHRADMSVSLQHKASTASGGHHGDVFSSNMHRDVSACLTHLGIEHENGVLCGPYLLDVVALDMVNPAKRIVYEVNSPHHYYEGTTALTAEKRLRHRMLSRLGQKLHFVNTPAWQPLSAAQKITYILKMQQEQQEENSRDAKQQAASNAMRAPLPSLRPDSNKKPEPFKLKSVRDFSAPICVPVPPSRRGM